jgi:hypothetical protein
MDGRKSGIPGVDAGWGEESESSFGSGSLSATVGSGGVTSGIGIGAGIPVGTAGGITPRVGSIGTFSDGDAVKDGIGSIRPMKRVPHAGHCTFFPSAASGTFSLRLHCVHLRRIVMTTPTDAYPGANDVGSTGGFD